MKANLKKKTTENEYKLYCFTFYHFLFYLLLRFFFNHLVIWPKVNHINVFWIELFNPKCATGCRNAPWVCVSSMWSCTSIARKNAGAESFFTVKHTLVFSGIDRGFILVSFFLSNVHIRQLHAGDATGRPEHRRSSLRCWLMPVTTLLLRVSLQTEHHHPHSRGLIWLSLLLRTTNREIERLGDAFFKLNFSFIFQHLHAPFYMSYMYFSCTTASHPPFSALNCRTPPPFSITISAFTRQRCRTHPASTHFEWRTLQHPEERGKGGILNKDKDAFRNYFSCRNCNFRNWREMYDLLEMKSIHSSRTKCY